MTRPNPFSTRFIRPGALPFVFPGGESLEQVVGYFQTPRAQGAILGPHGSGKSTLLETLAGAWPAAGLVEQRVRLTAASHREATALPRLRQETILVIDGFEQLSWWQQRWIRWRCWQKGARLLVTCHADCGVPRVLRTEPSRELARALAGQLLGGDTTPYDDELRRVWDENPGDVREYLFRLYHWYESHRSYRFSEDERRA